LGAVNLTKIIVWPGLWSSTLQHIPKFDHVGSDGDAVDGTHV
jgi:hypothetical protein